MSSGARLGTSSRTTTSPYGLPIDHPDSLYLGPEYFGLASDFEIGSPNYAIGTLAGGRREWEGLESVFRKRTSRHWQALASYSYADATGNTNSDSNTGFQGDAIWLDPRAVNREGTQDGSVKHLVKLAGSYQGDNGLSVGGVYRWNSGVVASRTFSASGRRLPLWDVNDPEYAGEPIQFAGGDGFGNTGASGYWISPRSVGQLQNPSYGVLDLRIAYLLDVGSRIEADFFLDVFNVADEQEITRAQWLVSGGGGIDFGEGQDFVPPRRFFLGARLRL